MFSIFVMKTTLTSRYIRYIAYTETWPKIVANTDITSELVIWKINGVMSLEGFNAIIAGYTASSSVVPLDTNSFLRSLDSTLRVL